MPLAPAVRSGWCKEIQAQSKVTPCRAIKRMAGPSRRAAAPGAAGRDAADGRFPALPWEPPSTTQQQPDGRRCARWAATRPAFSMNNLEGCWSTTTFAPAAPLRPAIANSAPGGMRAERIAPPADGAGEDGRQRASWAGRQSPTMVSRMPINGRGGTRWELIISSFTGEYPGLSIYRCTGGCSPSQCCGIWMFGS
jgi:hypothetical protein